MSTLLNYFNSLNVDARKAFLTQACLTEGYLRRACCRSVKMSPNRCVAIERATNGQVTRKDLRPHDWKDIWPELIVKCKYCGKAVETDRCMHCGAVLAEKGE